MCIHIFFPMFLVPVCAGGSPFLLQWPEDITIVNSTTHGVNSSHVSVALPEFSNSSFDQFEVIWSNIGSKRSTKAFISSSSTHFSLGNLTDGGYQVVVAACRSGFIRACLRPTPHYSLTVDSGLCEYCQVDVLVSWFGTFRFHLFQVWHKI